MGAVSDPGLQKDFLRKNRIRMEGKDSVGKKERMAQKIIQNIIIIHSVMFLIVWISTCAYGIKCLICKDTKKGKVVIFIIAQLEIMMACVVQVALQCLALLICQDETALMKVIIAVLAMYVAIKTFRSNDEMLSNS